MSFGFWNPRCLTCLVSADFAALLIDSKLLVNRKVSKNLTDCDRIIICRKSIFYLFENISAEKKKPNTSEYSRTTYIHACIFIHVIPLPLCSNVFFIDPFQIHIPFDFSVLYHNAEFLRRVETSQLIFMANRLNCFCMMGTLCRVVKCIKIKGNLKFSNKN